MTGSTIHRLTAIAGLAGALALTGGIALAKPNGEFFVQQASLTKQADGSWRGPGKLDRVTGTLTITGTVQLLKQEQHKIHWRWVAGTRVVAGCSYNSVLTRPHGVQLWDGGGRITFTSSKERKYQGRIVGLSGPTQSTDLTHAHISIREFKPNMHQPAPPKC